jgi:hypothetical protein
MVAPSSHASSLSARSDGVRNQCLFNSKRSCQTSAANDALAFVQLPFNRKPLPGWPQINNSEDEAARHVDDDLKPGRTSHTKSAPPQPAWLKATPQRSVLVVNKKRRFVLLTLTFFFGFPSFDYQGGG